MVLYRKASLILKETKSQDYPSCLNNLALSLQELERWAECLAVRKQVLLEFEILYGKSHPHYATGLYNFGMVYKKLKLPYKSVECFEKSLEMLKDQPNHPTMRQLPLHLAMARRAVVDKDYAFRMASLQRACEQCFKVVPSGKMDVCSGCLLSYYCGVISVLSYTKKKIFKSIIGTMPE